MSENRETRTDPNCWSGSFANPGCKAPQYQSELAAMKAERDAAVARCKRLEKAVEKRFTRTGTKDGMPAHECIECGDWNYAESKIEHAPDCCVREIQERREKAK